MNKEEKELAENIKAILTKRHSDFQENLSPKNIKLYGNNEYFERTISLIVKAISGYRKSVKLTAIDSINNPYILNNIAKSNNSTIYFTNGVKISRGDADWLFFAWQQGTQAQLLADQEKIGE